MSAPSGVIAVLACLEPDSTQLDTVFDLLCGQVDGLVLVDNGSPHASQVALRNHLDQRTDQRMGGLAITPILQSQNTGLGDAQNCGIRAALNQGARQILLLDQDSRPAPDMVRALLVALRAADTKGLRVAAIGPRYDEPHRDARQSSQTQAKTPDATLHTIPAVIASGALIPVEVLREVGLFDETLFIDLLDTEWCFRARAAGYGCFVAPAAQMTHRIGDQSLRLGGRDRAVHAPFRSYYQIRNLLLITRRPHVPKLWGLRQMAVMLPRALVMATLLPPRWQRATLPLLGLWHGILGRSGRLRD
jgi:rhamnosyltransferase